MEVWLVSARVGAALLAMEGVLLFDLGDRA